MLDSELPEGVTYLTFDNAIFDGFGTLTDLCFDALTYVRYVGSLTLEVLERICAMVFDVLASVGL